MNKKRQLETIISTLKRRISENTNDTARSPFVFKDTGLNNSQSSSGDHDVNNDVPPTPDSSPSPTDNIADAIVLPSCDNSQPQQQQPLSPVSPARDEFIPDDSDLENGPDQYLIDLKKQFENVDEGQGVEESDWSRSMLEKVETWSSDDDIEWSKTNSPNHQSSQGSIRQPHNVDECSEQAAVETDDDDFDPGDYAWGDEDDKEPAAISHVPSPDSPPAKRQKSS